MEAGRRDISAQERQLLQLLLSGQTVAVAAATLYISTRTAEAVLADLRRRTGAPTLYALGAAAERLGWHGQSGASAKSFGEADELVRSGAAVRAGAAGGGA